MELQLYNYFRSSAAYRVRIALHFKALEFEYLPVHLLNNGGEQNSVEYRTINPSREVPTLIAEGQAIGQSMAIIEYLDEVYKTPKLFPELPHQRARVRQLCEIINCTHPLQNLKVLQYLEKEYAVADAKKTQWLSEWIHRGFESFEEVVKPTSGKFSLGDEVTAADLFLVPQLFSAQRFGIDVSRYKTLAKINSNCIILESFYKSHPYRQIDTPEELRIT